MVYFYDQNNAVVFLAFNVNLFINGYGETGPCENSSGVTHPTGWNDYTNIL